MGVPLVEDVMCGSLKFTSEVERTRCGWRSAAGFLSRSVPLSFIKFFTTYFCTTLAYRVSAPMITFSGHAFVRLDVQTEKDRF